MTFMRGYLWNYKIDTRILNKEYLSINAKKRKILQIQVKQKTLF